MSDDRAYVDMAVDIDPIDNAIEFNLKFAFDDTEDVLATMCTDEWRMQMSDGIKAAVAARDSLGLEETKRMFFAPNPEVIQRKAIEDQLQDELRKFYGEGTVDIGAAHNAIQFLLDLAGYTFTHEEDKNATLDRKDAHEEP